MKAIVGRKVGMTQILQEDGALVPVTLIQAGPCTIVDVRNEERDGYWAVQVGFENSSKLNKSLLGHVKNSKVTPKIIKEFRVDSDIAGAAEIGSSFDVSVFEMGDSVMVSGTSKGKGFAGTIKRHNFARGPMTHGSRNIRKPGSIGSMYPQKIYKGRKLPGQMGSERVSIKNQSVAYVDTDNHVIGIRGAVPGPKNSIVTVVGGDK